MFNQNRLGRVRPVSVDAALHALEVILPDGWFLQRIDRQYSGRFHALAWRPRGDPRLMGQATGEGDTIGEAIGELTANLSARIANLSHEGGALVPKSTQNSGKNWTPGEVGQLRDLARHNTPTRVIGLKLGRTPDAVQSKASDKGISLKPTNQAPRTPKR
jgi:hypothetical protein